MQGFPPVTDCARHFFPPDQTRPVPRPPLLWRMLQRENHSSPESGLRPPLAPPETDTADSFWVPSVPTRLAGGPQDRGPSTCCQAGPGQGAMKAVAPPSRLHGRFSSSRSSPSKAALYRTTICYTAKWKLLQEGSGGRNSPGAGGHRRYFCLSPGLPSLGGPAESEPFLGPGLPSTWP